MPPPPGADHQWRRRRGILLRCAPAELVVVPRLPRSVGLGPVNSPPRLARTLHVSRTRSQLSAVVSGPERAMRISTAWTRRNKLVSCQVRSRRRSVAPEARPGLARSSHHWTPSRKKTLTQEEQEDPHARRPSRKKTLTQEDPHARRIVVSQRPRPQTAAVDRVPSVLLPACQ